MNAQHRTQQVNMGSMMPGSIPGIPQHGVLTHGHHSISSLGPHHQAIAQSQMPAHDQDVINKRPRLYIESKVSIHQPLSIQTSNETEVKKVSCRGLIK